MIDIDALAESIVGFLQEGKTDLAVEVLDTLRPPDAAQVLEELDDEFMAHVISSWSPKRAGLALAEIAPERWVTLSERVAPRRLAEVTNEVTPASAAQFLSSVEPERRQRVLDEMGEPHSTEVGNLLAFPPGTAGRIMSPRFLSVGEDQTVADILELLRREGSDELFSYYIYVLGGSNQLKGVLSLKMVASAIATTRVGSLMKEHPVTVDPLEDRETAATLIRRHDLSALPVTDELGRMYGVVDSRDALDVISAAARQRALSFAGSVPAADPGTRSVLRSFRRRLPWVLIGVAVELSIGFFLLRSLAVELLIQIVVFVPLLMLAGGNSVTSVAARLTARAGSRRTESVSPWLRAGEEFRWGLQLSALAFFISFVALLVLGRALEQAAAVGISVGIASAMGAALGASIPVGVHRLRLPATLGSTPFLALLSDVVVITVYLALARTFLS